ncbi:zinc ribbon domain-containing protein [Candidatus Leptofilum sp.]|uniref:zinc ribbon domain-containing protein n=1 Tax=Candidatus Leptofilum sp. TaxID=3241576 RepID=UPI003B58B95F
MKRTLFLLIAFLFLPTMMVQAQTAVTLQSLDVELWPDYDREAVLVLLTGALPADTALPATLTFPLPEGTDFNVAAHFTPQGNLTDQGITPQVTDNQVTFTTPNLRFRVEYYQPYAASNTQRSFTFSWQSDMAIEQMNVTLQQPFAATEVNTVPPASNVVEGQDGLTYHVLPSHAVAAGDSYNLEVGYTMSVATLTVDFLVQDEEDVPILDAVPVQDEETAFDWPTLLIGLGVLILVGTAVWYIINQRNASQSRRSAKPKPQRARKQPAKKTAVAAPKPSSTKANFCHQCGESLQATDKFCRNCGTKVKDFS